MRLASGPSAVGLRAAAPQAAGRHLLEPAGGGGLRAGVKPEPFWMRGFAFALDFQSNRYRLAGRPVSAAVIDGYHSRASARRAETGAGISRLFPDAAMAIVDGRYDSREGWVNLAEDPLLEGADPASGTLPANWGTIASGTQIVCVGTGQEDGLPYADIRIFGIPSNNVQLRFTRAAFIVATLNDVFTAEMSVRVVGGSSANISLVDVRSCETQGGSFLVSSDSIPYELTADRLANAKRSVARTFVNGSTNRAEARIRLQVTGQPIDITLRVGAPQFIRSAYRMPFGNGSIAGDSLVIPAFAAGLTTQKIGGKSLVMVWRGRDFESAGSHPRLLELRSDGTNRLTLFRRTSNGGVGVTFGAGGALPGSDLATASQMPYGSDATVVAIWRPDGTTWAKAAGQLPVTAGGRMFLTGEPGAIGVGCSGDTAAKANSLTRFAALGAFDDFSNTDALALFDRVAGT